MFWSSSAAIADTRTMSNSVHYVSLPVAMYHIDRGVYCHAFALPNLDNANTIFFLIFLKDVPHISTSGSKLRRTFRKKNFRGGPCTGSVCTGKSILTNHSHAFHHNAFWCRVLTSNK